MTTSGQYRERPVRRRRRDAVPGLIDELHLDGDSELEIDLTPDAGSPATTPGSRREAREQARSGGRARSRGARERSAHPDGRRVLGAAVATALVMLVPGVAFPRTPAPLDDAALNSADESYFPEPEGYIASSIFGDRQSPGAASGYAEPYTAAG